MPGTLWCPDCFLDREAIIELEWFQSTQHGEHYICSRRCGYHVVLSDEELKDLNMAYDADKIEIRNNPHTKILISWDPESSLAATTLKNAMSGINNGYVNVASHSGNLVLIWSPDWIGADEANTIVKAILSDKED